MAGSTSDLTEAESEWAVLVNNTKFKQTKGWQERPRKLYSKRDWETTSKSRNNRTRAGQTLGELHRCTYHD